MPGAPLFKIRGNMVRKVIPIGSKKWRPLGVTGPPKDGNYTCFIGPRNAQIFSLNNAQILIWPPAY